MKIKKNTEMEFLQVDEGNLVVFDPSTGNSHFIDETGVEIIRLIENETEVDMIIDTLAKTYGTSTAEISEDIHDFINTLIEKQVVRSI